MSNNNQIDNTDYYRLPCGKYLEDFIRSRNLTFAAGSALKYVWRAGKKDGENTLKDLNKADHYYRFIARTSGADVADVIATISNLAADAAEWDGESLGSNRVTNPIAALTHISNSLCPHCRHRQDLNDIIAMMKRYHYQ